MALKPSRHRTRLFHITTVPQTLSFFTGQVGYIMGKGFCVHAISSPGPLLDTFAEREKVPTHAVEMSRRINPVADVISVRGICRILRRYAPDIVHAHTPKAGLLGMISAWLCGVPVRIYTIHGLPLMTATGLRRGLLKWADKVACALAHEVFCVSQSVRAVVLKENLCPPNKIKVILNGSINGADAKNRFNPTLVSQEVGLAVRRQFAIPPGAQVIGFIGRIVRDKGLIELFRAWENLRVRFPDLHLLLVGPFEELDPLPAEVERGLRSDPRIHFAGMNWNTPPFYLAMDIFVLPTYREGFPVVPLEAAAMELPIVTTDVPGCVDAVEDGVTGTLVPVKDTNALTDALAMYLNDPALRQRHGRAGRQRVLHFFNQETIWEAVYNEYLRIMQTRGL